MEADIDKYKCDEPILLITFNRLEESQAVMRQIRQVKPSRLYLASDGPRLRRSGESAVVAEIRRRLISMVDWQCDVKTLWREENLGCKMGVSGAITWFFQNEESGIILEDDCVPSLSFFPFCSHLLNRYRYDTSVMGVCADYRPLTSPVPSNSYSRISVPLIWGWASWRRVWAQYDVEIKSWDGDMERFPQLANLDARCRAYWKLSFDRVQQGLVDTWDFQFAYTVLSAGGCFLHPFRNLVTNIGFGSKASHTRNVYDDTANLSRGDVSFPLREIPDFGYDHFLLNKYFRARPLLIRLARRMALSLMNRVR